MKSQFEFGQKSRHFHLSLNFIVLIFLLFHSIQLKGQNHEWPMSRYNIRNTAQSPYDGPVEQPQIIKSIQFSYIVGVPVVISSEGIIYVSCLNDTLYALNKDLNILWKRNVDTQIGGWGTSHPAIGPSGSVYIFDYNGNRLLALNPNTGSQIWETEDIGSYGRGIPVIGPNETIYIFAWGVNAISNTGARMWARPLANLLTTVALSPDSSRVYVSTCPQLGALNSGSGDDVWYHDFIPNSSCPHRPVVGADGTVYAASDDSLYAVSPDNEVKWSAYIGRGGRAGWTAIDDLRNQVYAASANDTLYAFNLQGSKLWTTLSGHYYWYNGAPIIGNNGVIYMLCQDDNTEHKLQAFNPTDGAKMWQITGSVEEGGTGSPISSQPVIGADGNIYVGNSRGIYVIGRPSSGVENKKSIATVQNFELYQNYPNPFNPSTEINYSIPENGFVCLKVYNILGEELATLVNENQKQGKHKTIYDGSHLSNGIYFYKLTFNQLSRIKKMTLVK